ncbi:MAG: CHASE2 domain-containing protein, partial [Thermotogaceae bacterium]|nr:CHASE2 domain-containing protein [Thermotogaceae bacterium]
MGRETRHLLYLSVVLIVIYFFSYALNLGWLRFIELKFQDLMYNLRGKLKIDPHVVVVGMDEKTLSWFEGEGDFWPLSRAKYAMVIHKLFQAGAKAVLLDVSFTNPSEEDPKGDRYLAAVLLLNKKVVLGTYLINEKKTYNHYNEIMKKELEDNTGYLRYVYKMKNFQDLSLITPISIYKIRPPIKIFADVVPVASFEVAAVDMDGKIRRLPLFIEEKWAIETKKTSGFLPHMDILGYALYLGQNPIKTDLVVDFRKKRIEIPVEKNGIKIKTYYVPFDSHGLFNLYYYGEGEDNFSTIPFLNVYRGNPAELKKFVDGKIVIIGYTATAKGLYDLRVTPFSNNEPGVYIHATAVENMIRGDNLKTIPFLYELILV